MASMVTRTLETDYLVIGSGAAGMAFTDSLVAESDANVIVVDRRAAPGGHWNDAYPFVRLHQPSVYYGVNSIPLGSDAIWKSGPEAGQYERATGLQIRAYYERVMHECLIPSGRVTYFPQCDYVGDSRIVRRLCGEIVEVKVHKKIVDATWLSPYIPADTPPQFEIGAGVTCVPVNQLTQLKDCPDKFVIIGAGKTAMDACVWLIENGVAPRSIQWIKPREPWLLNRRYAQPGELLGMLFDGIALQMEAAARATSVDDLFHRLEAFEQVTRIDRAVWPTMYKAATIADWEIDRLRRIEDVVRLGRVLAIQRNQIILEHGTIPTQPGHLHVHCSADGLPRRPLRPIFESGCITLQQIRMGLIPFNAALIGFVEAHRDNDVEKNRLCPVNSFPDIPLDWARTTLTQMRADREWRQHTDISEWLERSRLNASRGRRARSDDLRLQQASQRISQYARSGLERLGELCGAR
jgi:hypothetical protein